MTFNVTATAVFVVVTVFTPGPNNLLSGSMGVIYGYRPTLPFLAGVASGCLVVMTLCAALSSSLTTWFPSAAAVVRWVGAAYILWLAVGIYRRSSTLLAPEPEDAERPRYWKGLVLQFVNPKGVFYGLTLFTVFLTPLLDQPLAVAVSLVILTAVTFTAISTWAVGGHLIRGWISTPARAQALGLGLALALVYSALDVAGVFAS